MPRRCKNKGSNFERELARRIGEWWCDDRDAFWRTSGSGARAHRDNIHPGDIGPIKNIPQFFPFCIEARCRESWSLDEILKSKVPDVLKWTVENSEVAGSNYLSMLIVKRNYFPTLVIIPNWVPLTISKSPDIQMGVSFHPNYFSVLIMELNKFFELFQPKDFIGVQPNSASLRELKEIEVRVCKDIQAFLDSKRVQK